MLRGMSARLGLADMAVSDNGPQFTSHEFASFMKVNGIEHRLTPTHHPSPNGQAERFVQILKKYISRNEAVTDMQKKNRSVPHGREDNSTYVYW